MVLLAEGWTGLMTGTLLAGLGFLVATGVTIYFLKKHIEHEKTSEVSFALRKNKFWISMLIRYVYAASIILLVCGSVISFAVFGVSVHDNF